MTLTTPPPERATVALELLFPSPPRVPGGAAFADALRRRLDCRVEPLPDRPHWLLGLPGGATGVPPQVAWLEPDEDGPPADLGPLLDQTWDWPEAAGAVASARHRRLLAFVGLEGLPARVAARVLRGSVACTVEASLPCAVAWHPAGRVVRPDVVVLAHDDPANEDFLWPSVNIRMFEDPAPGHAVLLDTLGLGTYGLPDLQAHFRPDTTLTRGRVAFWLSYVARFVAERPGSVGPGDTFPGPGGGSWRCGLEQALVGPERGVIDLDPGGAASARG